jgi:hypothetical protein
MDYLGGLVLIAAPWLLGFSELDGPAVWVPVTIGAGMIALALMTAYEYGLVGLVSMPGHLVVDFIVGAMLAASPWLFGFASDVWVPHVVLGVGEMGAALMTRTVPTSAPGGSMRTTMR